MADWVVFLAIVLTVLGAPFVGVMAMARRVSGTQAPVARRAVWACAWFVIVTTLLSAAWRWAAMHMSYGPGIIALGAGSFGAAWAVWQMTHRRALAAMVTALSAGAGPLFFAVEDLTHGPFYVRSEGLAILGSMAVTALIWHACVAGMLLGWAMVRGRSETRARQGRCIACGYDLSGTPTRTCPECGKVAPKA